MSEFTLKVTPEILTAAASDISSQVTVIKNAISSIDSTVSQMPIYWKGEAADVHIGVLKELMPEFEKIISSFSSDADRLNSIAGNYSLATNEALSAVEGLPSDVIK